MDQSKNTGGGNKLIIFGLFIASALLIVLGPQLMAKGGAGKDISKEAANQNKLPESNLPLLVEFYTDTCEVCAEVKPILAKVEKEFEGRVNVARINTELNENAMLAYDFKITGVPEMFAMPDGKKPVYRMVGFVPEDQLRDIFKKLANKESFKEEKKDEAKKP